MSESGYIHPADFAEMCQNYDENLGFDTSSLPEESREILPSQRHLDNSEVSIAPSYFIALPEAQEAMQDNTGIDADIYQLMGKYFQVIDTGNPEADRTEALHISISTAMNSLLKQHPTLARDSATFQNSFRAIQSDASTIPLKINALRKIYLLSATSA